MQVFILEHNEYCAAYGSCGCTDASGTSAARLPETLTLPALSSFEVCEAVLSVSCVRRAIQSGDVTLTHKPDPASNGQAAPSGTDGQTLVADPGTPPVALVPQDPRRSKGKRERA
jgi:hypothetical protein